MNIYFISKISIIIFIYTIVHIENFQHFNIFTWKYYKLWQLLIILKNIIEL